MDWIVSTKFMDFLLPFLVFIFCMALLMFFADSDSKWERPKWFKYTYIALFLLPIVSVPFLALYLIEETVYATDWKQIYQNDKDIDLTLAFDAEFKERIPLNKPLAGTSIYSNSENSAVLKYPHYLALSRDNMSIARKTKVTELVGNTGSTAKIVKVEYRKIDYTYNRLFNFKSSHEKSDYDGELRLTFDNGLDSTTNQELVNLLEK